MIQINKTFFQFTKLLAIVVMLIGVSNTVWAGGLHSTYTGWPINGSRHYSKVEVEKSHIAAGTVYVYTADKPTGETLSAEDNCNNHTYVDYVAFSSSDKHEYNLSVTDNGKYLWVGWYLVDGDSEIQETKEANHTTSVTAISTNSQKPTTKKYKAKWLLPTVASVDLSNKNITIYEKTSQTQPITFSLVDDVSKDNFTLSATPNPPFASTTVTYETGSYSTGLQYTPTGVHTAYQSSYMTSELTANVGTLTLKSNYTGAGTASSKSFTWTVREDYTPWFEMQNTECVFASVTVGTPSTSISEGTISPSITTWNYAAKQAYPTMDEGDDPTSPEDNKLVEGTIWKIKLTNNPNNIFTIDATKTEGEDEEGWYKVTKNQLTIANQTLITFTPPLNATTDDVYTATLNVKCEYYDAVGNIIPALQKNGNDWGNELLQTVTLKGEAMLVPSILLNNKEEESVAFDAVVCGSTPLKYSNGTEVTAKDITYITNISAEDLQQSITGDGKDYFDIDVDREEAKISVTLKSNITPGTHSATLTISGTYVDKDENGEETTGIKTATLTITANVILANPVLSGYAGNATAHLEWDAIAGATEYDLYYQRGSTINVGEGTRESTTSTSLDLSELENTREYAFILVAKNGTLTSVSNVLILRPDNIPNTIDYKNRITSLYTGTDHDLSKNNGIHPKNGEFPYMTKRKVDVSAAFDANTEEALFDYVVIFATTNGTENEDQGYDDVSYTTAKTPCYVYQRTDDITYTLKKLRGSDPSYEMNNANKHPYFTIPDDNDDDEYDGFSIPADGLSIYMTGYCPYASTGSTWKENAVMHITGSSETKVDIYLDNAQIFARPKKNNGTVEIGLDEKEGGDPEEPTIMQNWLDATNGFMKGSGAVFAFTSTNYGFAPKIHIARYNTLKSHYGVTLNNYVQLKIDGKNNTFYGEYKQYSSPIQCLPTSLNTPVNLTIDDVWPFNMRMNGSLKLETSHTDAPLVDLGLSESSMSFAGGKITLQNNNGVSVASHNIHIRTDNITTSKGSGNQSTTIYGASTAANQNSGTKATHSGGKEMGDITVRFADGTYSSTTTLTVPTQTIVEGGSYNCTFATTMYNSLDTETRKPLTLIPTDIPSTVATVNENNGVAMFTDGLNSFKDLMDYIYPNANWKDQDNPKHYASLSTYYDGANKSYGYSSLTPDAENKVYLMLPKEGQPTVKKWAISGPDFTATTGDKRTNQQTENTIHCTSQKENNFGKTYNMLYMETDGYTQSAVADGSGYEMSYGEGENKISATITSNCATAQIKNSYEYIISDRVYIMKPLVATDWMLFCPPFDVANVYIVEAYPEKQLIEDYKGDNKVSIPAANIQAARKAQAQRFMDLYVYWYNYGELQGGSDYFYDEANDALGQFIMDWAEYETKRGKDGVAVTGNAYQPVINKLQHFMGYEDSAYPEGMHWWDANYFLYESVGAWTPTTSGDYTPTWNEVKKPSKDNNAIMKAGKVYAMNFPYNVIGGHNPNTTWDYWTGKYIIIESTKRPKGHTIKGGSYDMQGIKTTDANKAWMCGNPTFTALSVTASDENQVYTVENNYGGTTIDGTDTTIVVNSYTMIRNENGGISIPSTKGFVLANPPAPVNMRARSINYKSGEVEYEKIDNPDDDNPGLGSGVPTIMNGMTLIVEPTSEGLTITPIKEQHVMLFDADGKMIFSKHLSAEENVTLPTGVYVVRGEYEQVKAIKK